MKISSAFFRRWVIAAIVLALVGQACTFELFEIPSFGATSTPGPIIPTTTPLPVAQTTFVVTLPEPLLQGEALFVVVLDEVTGLPLRPSRETHYQMTARDATTYTVNLALSYNSVVKYRYLRTGSNGTVVIEDTVADTPIRYRVHHVSGPAEVVDAVASWGDRNYTRPKGTVIGKIYNAETGFPIPNLLVTAAGIQSITNSLGEFELNNVLVGEHQVTIYSMDGAYQIFQQRATIGDNLITEVNVSVRPTRLVNVTFVVRIPQDSSLGRPVRIAGNILQLGNTFADLQGGMSVVADRMPVMLLQTDGSYYYTAQLPVGTFIEYKYTLGDGFWNAEHKEDGGWMLRQFIVPEQDITLQDAVASWKDSNDSGAILFEVNVPSVTPASDGIYIQFKHPLGWTEPIPMWQQDAFRWVYRLYGPLGLNTGTGLNGTVAYRFCRNGQCGSADDNKTVGISPTTQTVTTTFTNQDILYTVDSWKWYENPGSTEVVGYNITQRAPSFVTGVEFQPTYRPNFVSFTEQAFKNTNEGIRANYVILTPTWSFSSVSPLKLAPQFGQDPLWSDTGTMVLQARNNGLNVALFPTPQFKPTTDTSISAADQFWRDAPKDAAWWDAYFKQYRSFLLNYADLAAQSGAQSIVLGGEWLTPALPGGTLRDGSGSNVPADADARWRSMIQEIRARFKGQILWALPYERSNFVTTDSFLRDVDVIYLLWSAPLATSPTAAKGDYINEAGRLLDTVVFPLSSLLGNKPIIIAASYPAASGAANGCVSNGAGGCLDYSALARPNADIQITTLSLQTQTDLYESMLSAVNARSWIAGFVSRGYYLPAALQDKSTSVHGKPTGTVLWYWYGNFRGIR